VFETGVARTANDVRIAQRGALFDQQAGDVRIVAQQDARHAVGQFGQRRQTRGHPLSLIVRGQPQHLDQQVACHRPLEGVDPAGGQGHDIGQTLQQRPACAQRRLRRRLLPLHG